jgi:hypothetical protein
MSAVLICPERSKCYAAYRCPSEKTLDISRLSRYMPGGVAHHLRSQVVLPGVSLLQSGLVRLPLPLIHSIAGAKGTFTGKPPNSSFWLRQGFARPPPKPLSCLRWPW